MQRSCSPIALAAAVLCVAIFTSPLAKGQSTEIGDLGVGKLLVSAKGLSDPNFAQSVVLLIRYDDKDGALGLIINRRTQASLSRVLKGVDTAKRGSDPVYLGGPVELDAVFALLRSQKKPDEASSVLSEVYLLSSKAPLEKALAASSGPGDLRVYVGYAGWDVGQLENEVRLGGWWIFEASPGTVFDPNPDTVWSRLITRTDTQIARVSILPTEMTRVQAGR
ncbi:MAG TPA: YqgE/AlgH family protein [Terriglobia bacterium]|nr:YqgE/AlgH family protein [Terriglobia bacterium]